MKYNKNNIHYIKESWNDNVHDLSCTNLGNYLGHIVFTKCETLQEDVRILITRCWNHQSEKILICGSVSKVIEARKTKGLWEYVQVIKARKCSENQCSSHKSKKILVCGSTFESPKSYAQSNDEEWEKLLKRARVKSNQHVLDMSASLGTWLFRLESTFI